MLLSDPRWLMVAGGSHSFKKLGWPEKMIHYKRNGC
jgi:hypothetical protein